MSAIAKIYVRLIHKGIRTLDKVPKKIRAEVAKLLEAEKENGHLQNN